MDFYFDHGWNLIFGWIHLDPGSFFAGSALTALLWIAVEVLARAMDD
jgi:hypothetical protein